MNYFVDSFDLPISLRMLHQIGNVLDDEFLIKLNESSIDELSIVVGEDDMWYAKTTYYILP